MKKMTKIFLIGFGTVLVLIVLAVGFMFWKMGQPVYKFGVVSEENNLRSSLEPPDQTDSNKLSNQNIMNSLKNISILEVYSQSLMMNL